MKQTGLLSYENTEFFETTVCDASRPVRGHDWRDSVPLNFSLKHVEERDTFSGRKILLVEDHEQSRFVTKAILEKRNYIVFTASTVHEALHLASQHPFCLVISDIGLPDGTGHELMALLSARFGLQGIATSGYDSDAARTQSTVAGFAFHLVKPLNVEMLESALSHLLKPEA